MFKKLLLGLLVASGCALTTYAQTADERDNDNRLVMYVRGDMTNGWSCQDNYRFTRTGDTYTITLPTLDGEFKISSSEWNFNYGAPSPERLTVDDACLIESAANGGNLVATGLTDVTIRFEMGEEFKTLNYVYISANGHEAPESPGVIGLSGTLPVLYINVFEEDGVTYDNEIIDRNLDHKNYFAGQYWLDLNGCAWLEELGAESIGSKDAPLPLEIKARGNYTRKAFAKKPFKLKLGQKQKMLGLSKSKHFALLAHADDNYGYLRNFTGFNLGRRIGLPWTPWQQPVEVVINGDYRGLYFLTESIRIEPDRINITELDDNVSEAALVSGGYLIELDNYDEENQTQMPEHTCVPGHYLDMLRVTWDTPEVYSDVQKRFITDQFSAMNDFVGQNSDELWKYMDLDDAARYYLVEEIMSHTESYHGSTYLFRDRGEGQKWHFSPLWDFGNGFNGDTDNFFYNCDLFGNTWIPSIRENETFNDKVRQTWIWFMNTGYDGIVEDIDQYVSHIADAAKADHRRWASAPVPDNGMGQVVTDNSDMQSRREAAVARLAAKTEWLKSQFGDYTTAGQVSEPARDTTPAAPLPDYAKGDPNSIQGIDTDAIPADGEVTFFNLQGMKVAAPVKGQTYIMVRGGKSMKFTAR